MIIEIATVESINDNKISVKTAIKTTCDGCSQRSDCATGAVASGLAPRHQRFQVICQQPVKVGDKVQIGIPETTIVRGAFFVYILPLLVMLSTAVTSSIWLPTTLTQYSELITVLLTVAMTAISFFLVKQKFSVQGDESLQPKFVALVTKKDDQIDCFTPPTH